MKNQEWSEISQQMIERYDARFRARGRHIRTLGWGSEDQQSFRFHQTLDAIPAGPPQSILDIGCGFGDYLAFLKKNSLTPKTYTGLDITPSFISESYARWENDDIETSTEFKVFDISQQIPSQYSADFVLMLGLLNLKLEGSVHNYTYSKRLIENAFSCTEEVLIVDFLSAQRDPAYPKEDFIFYHQPETMLEFALTLTSNVVMKHNYAPIPQKEFMLFLYK